MKQTLLILVSILCISILFSYILPDPFIILDDFGLAPRTIPNYFVTLRLPSIAGILFFGFVYLCLEYEDRKEKKE